MCDVDYILKLLLFQHPSICEFPSKQFYDDKLKTHRALYRRPAPGRLMSFMQDAHGNKHCPILFCDLVSQERESHTGHHKAVRVGLESKYNPTEADYLVSSSCNT